MGRRDFWPTWPEVAASLFALIIGVMLYVRGRKMGAKAPQKQGMER